MAAEILKTNHVFSTASVNGEDLNRWKSNDHPEMTLGMKIEYEAIPKFEEIRTKLVPLIKTDVWLKSTKDHLQKTSSAASHSVFYKPLNKISRIEVGFTVAILSGEDVYHYVLNNYLTEWHISSSTLVQISQANLRKRVIQESNTWQTSQTGIRFIQGLGAMTASLILLPDVIESLAVLNGNPVACIPTGHLCMIGDSQNVTQLCVMGEIALKFIPEVGSFLSTQPLRLHNREWKVYEANKANDEHLFPRSGDEVKMLKRALKMQGKI